MDYRGQLVTVVAVIAGMMGVMTAAAGRGRCEKGFSHQGRGSRTSGERRLPAVGNVASAPRSGRRDIEA